MPVADLLRSERRKNEFCAQNRPKSSPAVQNRSSTSPKHVAPAPFSSSSVPPAQAERISETASHDVSVEQANPSHTPTTSPQDDLALKYIRNGYGSLYAIDSLVEAMTKSLHAPIQEQLQALKMHVEELKWLLEVGILDEEVKRKYDDTADRLGRPTLAMLAKYDVANASTLTAIGWNKFEDWQMVLE